MLPQDILRPLFSYVLGLDDLENPKKSELLSSTLGLMFEAYASGRLQQKAQPVSKLPAAVERALEAIRENTLAIPPPRLGLSDLARHARCSPASLNRLFKESLQLSPLEYLKLCRLERAAKNLRQSSSSIKDLALQHGFYDAFHFSKSFKEVYGMSPREFRECDYNDWLSQRNPIIRTFYSLVHAH